ncbi:PPOX class F420-dependent oxidoreductase [Mycobacterium sp. NPDC050041]|uniref:PPOX class F420-dependent oxidoreductase n=1 Tax=Mycobacterium sp. NPDC050041 TaxID=3364293 RepID=UPI003C305438
MHTLDDLRTSRYALLRSYRRDGSPVDTPIWFAFEGSALVFRTKIGPKTRRLTNDPRVQLQVCDHRGRVGHDGATVDGRASILDGAAAEAANELLRGRYGWQYNVVPLLKIPGVRNVHSNLPWREKLRRARDRGLWNDSAIVRIDL